MKAFKRPLGLMLFFIGAILWLTAATPPPFDSTTQGRIILRCDGVRLSEHLQSDEATSGAINYAVAHGGKANCEKEFPKVKMVFAIPMTTPAPPPVTPPTVPQTTATLTWGRPVSNTDGSPLTDLAGYTVYYGRSATQLDQTIRILVPTATAWTVDQLTTGTWYFAVTALNAGNGESDRSNIVSKTL